MTSARIRLMLDPEAMLLSFLIGFSLVSAAVVCAILEMISGLDTSSVTTDPSSLKLCTVSSRCPLAPISSLMPLVLLVVSLVFSALMSTPLEAEGGWLAPVPTHRQHLFLSL